MGNDLAIQESLQAALAEIGVPAPGVDVAFGVASLSGVVRSERERRLAADLAIAVEGVRVVENTIAVDLLLEEIEAPAGTEPLYGPDAAEIEDTLEQLVPLEEPEDVMSERAEPSDVLRDVEEAEPYFPPVDPVIEPQGRLEGGYKVLGGYADDVMDGSLEAEPAPARMELNDLQIAENVGLALKEDAATIGLNIAVHVRNGVVYLRGTVRYLQDVEAAEEIAGRIAGVREVREQLQLE